MCSEHILSLIKPKHFLKKKRKKLIWIPFSLGNGVLSLVLLFLFILLIDPKTRWNNNKNKGGGGCGRFWNLPIYWSSSLHNRVTRFFFGMNRVIIMILIEQKLFCSYFRSADKSPKSGNIFLCDTKRRL